MEETNGSGRGSFIWGRSIHNTRIERLWYDVTHGFGKKWKVFFLDLEANHGLNPTRPGHIWLLHHLFLSSVNRDALDPRDLSLFGMLREGPRGISSFLAPGEEEEIENIDEYGIDWEVNEEPELVAHLLEHNPHERFEPDNDPFAPSSTPANFSELQLLDSQLSADVGLFFSQT
ncbi:hypothetical protein B0H14DRAFT_3094951 [Mycena olivaceomarginata]|nr:hypothetical protein B0H14DRAFT_3094951 [Mycena olivaceomarginata]